MKAYTKAYDLWEVVEMGRDPPPLPNNPTLAQMNNHSEELVKKCKALSCIHSSTSKTIFARIMVCDTTKEAWVKIKEEFQGSDRTRQMQVLNLRREFEILRMEESETVKEYTDRLMNVVNQIQLLGEDLIDNKIIEKVLVSLPKRFEAKISSIEGSKDLIQLTILELVNIFQALEQRRAIRQEDAIEGAFYAKYKNKGQASTSNEGQNFHDKRDQNRREGDNKENEKRGRFLPCSTCQKNNSLGEKIVRRRPSAVIIAKLGISINIVEKNGINNTTSIQNL
ncbi:uncharacterized protein LOC105640964 [Jatropha curcas]|uniref:uncharacterized protein LOC105640964 n=1 Tax=Jatropha curcas TaxID=180498 RepID=UPI0005FC241B|nr:uncharacterized protein LOC105640964 [Jatropha curcas]